MGDGKCDVCGEDPGHGSTCQRCGSRQYRYATDDLFGDSQSSDSEPELEDVATVLRKRIGASGGSRPSDGIDDSSDAWSQEEQASAIENLEHPTSGHMATKKKGNKGCGCLLSVLGIFVLIGVGIIAFLFTQVDEFRDAFDEEFNPVPATQVDAPASTNTTGLLEPVALDSWLDAAPRDCFLFDNRDDGNFPPTVVDCREPHEGEFFFIGDLPFGDWPGNGVADETADELCLEEFEAYIGVEYAESIWYSNGLYPSEEQWNDGDKSFHCYVYIPEQDAEEIAAGSSK